MRICYYLRIINYDSSLKAEGKPAPNQTDNQRLMARLRKKQDHMEYLLPPKRRVNSSSSMYNHTEHMPHDHIPWEDSD